MNPFNQKAADDGLNFIRNFPLASNVDIDNAAPKFNPARTHFQNAAHGLKDRLQLWPTWHRWEVSVEEYTVVGFSESFENAYRELNLMKKLEEQAGHVVQSFYIEDSAGDVRAGRVLRFPSRK